MSSDRTTIYVDQSIFENVESRYLFTLAHEIGHLVLHASLYKGYRADEEWKVFHRDLAGHTLNKAEYQANTFAGLVLVPEAKLAAAAEASFRALSKQVIDEEPAFDLSSTAFWSYIAEDVGRTFRVATDTARIRLENDKLWGRRW